MNKFLLVVQVSRGVISVGQTFFKLLFFKGIVVEALENVIDNAFEFYVTWCFIWIPLKLFKVIRSSSKCFSKIHNGVIIKIPRFATKSMMEHTTAQSSVTNLLLYFSSSRSFAHQNATTRNFNVNSSNDMMKASLINHITIHFSSVIYDLQFHAPEIKSLFFCQNARWSDVLVLFLKRMCINLL